MTKFISIANQKGGCGKSTVTVMLANYIYHNTDLSVVVIDCDHQKSLVKMRKLDKDSEDFPVEIYDIEYVDPKTLAKVFGKLKGEVDIVLVDVPGNIMEEGIISIFEIIDFMFIPVSTGIFEMDSTLNFVQIYNNEVLPVRKRLGLKTHLSVFLNRVNPDTLEVKDFVTNKDSFPIPVLDSFLVISNDFKRHISSFKEFKYLYKNTDIVNKLCKEIVSIVLNN